MDTKLVRVKAELVDKAHKNGLCAAKVCNIALKEASDKMEKKLTHKVEV